MTTKDEVRSTVEALRTERALKLALEALDHNLLFTSLMPGYDGRIIQKAYNALREALAQSRSDEDQPAPATELREQQSAERGEPVKLWLWKNFVKGRPEYWAFDNAFPVNMNNDDPQVIGEPCGYAWLKPSRQGRFDVSDEEVLRAVQNAKEYPPASKPWVHATTWRGLTDEEVMEMAFNFDVPSLVIRTAEAKLREKNEPREKNA